MGSGIGNWESGIGNRESVKNPVYLIIQLWVEMGILSNYSPKANRSSMKSTHKGTVKTLKSYKTRRRRS
ncbi:MAG: hypothetical protein F6K50_09065 [Moorea sp. SIO3I7]|nr:hypothetical protein [Moorena sp. SIO3I7]NEQ83323.1 hypothetical protein [Moorena sp. SIO2I5]